MVADEVTVESLLAAVINDFFLTGKIDLGVIGTEESSSILEIWLEGNLLVLIIIPFLIKLENYGISKKDFSYFGGWGTW